MFQQQRAGQRSSSAQWLLAIAERLLIIRRGIFVSPQQSKWCFEKKKKIIRGVTRQRIQRGVKAPQSCWNSRPPPPRKLPFKFLTRRHGKRLIITVNCSFFIFYIGSFIKCVPRLLANIDNLKSKQTKGWWLMYVIEYRHQEVCDLWLGIKFQNAPKIHCNLCR